MAYNEHLGDRIRQIELTETITKNKLAHTFEANYHHIHMDNTMKCNFKAINDHKTRCEYEYEYTRINWIMPRLFAILFPVCIKNHDFKRNTQTARDTIFSYPVFRRITEIPAY